MTPYTRVVTTFTIEFVPDNGDEPVIIEDLDVTFCRHPGKQLMQSAVVIPLLLLF